LATFIFEPEIMGQLSIFVEQYEQESSAGQDHNIDFSQGKIRSQVFWGAKREGQTLTDWVPVGFICHTAGQNSYKTFTCLRNFRLL
jgi:hypothetical protein